MRRETRRTILYAALLGATAFAAPFVALLPVLPVSGAPPSPTPVPQSTTAPGAALPSATPVASAAETAPEETPAEAPAPQPLLLYDRDSERVLEVEPLDYMIGVAACEMPADWPDDALRAQMVAGYTYALYCAANGGGTEGAAVEINRAQCSGWTDAEVLKSRWGDDFDTNYDRLKALAEGVLGSAVLYDGAPAMTCYHSISCGRTEASESVWSEALPYLCGVDSAWDKYSEDYETTLQYTDSQVAAALAEIPGLTAEGEPETWFGDCSWDAAGYVRQISVCGQAVTGPDLRRALQLRSACFAIAWRGGAFVITTRGYGHGVGLSQYGAYCMAQGGAGWRKILTYYFPETVIGTVTEAAT